MICEDISDGNVKRIIRRVKLLGDLVDNMVEYPVSEEWYKYLDWTSLFLCEDVDRFLDSTRLDLHQKSRVLDEVFLIRNYLREYLQKDAPMFKYKLAIEVYSRLIVYLESFLKDEEVVEV